MLSKSFVDVKSDMRVHNIMVSGTYYIIYYYTVIPSLFLLFFLTLFRKWCSCNEPLNDLAEVF